MAEFVVAASDSVPASRRFGDRFTVGDHTPIIQRAIDALPTVGGTVRILAGNYLLKRVVGTNHCIAIDKSNVRMLLEPGTILKIADGEAPDNALDMIAVTHTAGSVSGFQLWGPGIIDGNRANNPGVGSNLTISNRGLVVSGTPTDVWVGGGITFREVAGVCVDIVGPPTAPAGDRIILNGIICRDSGEGLQARHLFFVRVNGFLIDNMTAQDGLELVSVQRFSVTNGIIKNTRDECLDIPATSQAVEFGVISNLMLGPKIAGGPAQAIVSFGGDGSTQPVRNVTMSNFAITMGNAKMGIEIAGAVSLSTGGTKGITIGPGIIDGALAAALSNPAGIAFGALARRTKITGVQIDDCNNGGSSAAIDIGGTLGGDPDDLHIIACGGWNNVADILTGTGLQNTFADNTWQADSP